ncbi:hypothetical protein OU980_14560 [Aliarcobacter butzleri]
MKEYIQKLKIPEKNGKKIGLFRTICSIFGGLIVAYLGMTLLIFIIPGNPGGTILFSLVLNIFVWASVILWISLSKTKYIALLRVVIPTIVFSILLIIFYNI